jgi:dsRNA-specific ribonuclease
VRDLNNYLMRYRDARGNLARHFSWHLQQEGPDRQKTHYATAKREPLSESDNWALNSSRAVHGQNIGSGSGPSLGIAKHDAASQALQYLESLPAKHPLFSLN